MYTPRRIKLEACHLWGEVFAEVTAWVFLSSVIHFLSPAPSRVVAALNCHLLRGNQPVRMTDGFAQEFLHCIKVRVSKLPEGQLFK